MKRILIIVIAVLVAVPAGLYAWTRLSPHQVRSEIQLDATPQEVWQELTDFSSYKEWNPFMVSAAGEAKVGATLKNQLKDNGGVTTFEPTVLVADAGHELRWIGHFGIPGIADGEHYFILEPAAGGTKLIQGETFTGMLVPFAGSALEVEDDFEAMNQALKKRVEK